MIPASTYADLAREVSGPAALPSKPRTHLAVYQGPLYEASRVTKRLGARRTPTHRKDPR